MQTENVFKLRGCLEIALLNAYNGKVVEQRRIENLVVTAGRRWILENIMSGNALSSTVLNYLAIGTSTAAPATGDTGLGSETTRLAIQSFDTTNISSNPPSYQIQVSFATNLANTTLAEAGLFNSSAAGTMLTHATFGTLNKTTSNTLSISYTLSN